MNGYILTALGTLTLCALVALYPALRSRWQQRNDPPGLARWAGGRMPAWPKGMTGSVPADREPIGPSMPKVIKADLAGAEVVELDRRRAR